MNVAMKAKQDKNLRPNLIVLPPLRVICGDEGEAFSPEAG
jgi:hypothetical protein